jgi:hypothetical protein
MSQDLGFTFTQYENEIHVYHHGKKATVLRGTKAKEFEDEIGTSDFASQQQLMARLTGNYKRGNERLAKSHPRNRGS